MRAVHVLHALWLVVAIASPIKREVVERYDLIPVHSESCGFFSTHLNILMTQAVIE